MSFVRLHKLITYVLSGLGLWALSMGAELSPPVLAVMAVLFVLSWFAEGPRIHSSSWQRAWTTAVVAVLGLQLFRGLTGGPSFGLAVEFAAFLTLSRLFNRRSGTDHQQIIVLAFLHLIAGTVLTNSLGYGLLFVGFVVCTPWMLALTHLRVEIEAHYPVDEEDDRAAQVRRVLASRRIVGPAFLGWTAALSVPLFLSTIAMFVLFPRVGFGMMSMGERRGQAVAGFGDDIELGGFGRIRDDPTVVLRLTPDRKLSVGALEQMWRLRGTAFDHYDGRRWTRSEASRKRMRHMGEYYPVRRAPHDSDVRVRIVLESLDEPVLFLPQGTVGLQVPYVGSAGSRHSRQITRGHGLDLRYDASDGVGLVYEAVMSTRPSELTLPPGDDAVLSKYLQLPARHDRVIRFARELTRDDDTPQDRVRTLLRHMREEGGYRYSLEQGEPDGRPPLISFLFGHKRGHCEYFATSLAIMLRAVGVPTRNVTGFVGAEFNPYGNYFAVTQSKAHSWVEALLPGRGWVMLDPTPPDGEAFGASRSIAQVLRDLYDAARTYWLMEVLGYDLRTQLSGLRSLARWFQGLSGWTGAAGGDREARSQDAAAPDFEDARPVVLGVGALLLSLLGVWLWRRYRRPTGPHAPALRADAARARRLYLDLERALAQAGKPRAPFVTPERHASELEREGFAGAPTVRRVTDVYVRARYGGDALDGTTLEALERDVQALRRAG